MSKSKHARLISELGNQMAESAGGSTTNDDRFAGFTPSDSASGEMALDRIMEDDEQPRKSFDKQALNDFASHLKVHGVQQAIQLRWSEKHSKWLIVYGHRRYRAAKLAGFKTIPCTFMTDDVDEPTIRIRQLVENCQREDLAPMEMAKAIDALSTLTKWSNRRIAEELGFNHTTVGRYLSLLKLPKKVQTLVENRDLAPSVAAEISKVEDRADQEALCDEIAGEKLSRAQAKQAINRVIEAPRSSTVKPKEKQLLVQSVNVAVYRNPDASDLRIQKELLQIAGQLDPEKAES